MDIGPVYAAHLKKLGFHTADDLLRVPGVGSEYSDLLEAAGVNTVKELRRRSPRVLSPPNTQFIVIFTPNYCCVFWGRCRRQRGFCDLHPHPAGKATQWCDRRRMASDPGRVCNYIKADQPATGTDGCVSSL